VIPVIPSIALLEAAMMGRQTGDQASLFYEFRLDDCIPKNHLPRRIKMVVGPVLNEVSGQLKPYYSEIGRSSVDPELMIRMLIVGYCFSLRSERGLIRKWNYIWLTAGFAGSTSKTGFRITPRFLRTGCAAFGRVTSFGSSLRVLLPRA
jgi:transposase